MMSVVIFGSGWHYHEDRSLSWDAKKYIRSEQTGKGLGRSVFEGQLKLNILKMEYVEATWVEKRTAPENIHRCDEGGHEDGWLKKKKKKNGMVGG